MEAFKNKRILITGINGYIAHYLYKYLHSTTECKEIYGIDIATSSYTDKDLIYIKGDITNIDETEKILRDIKPNYVFHLAANIKPSRDIHDLNNMVSVNIIGTANMLNAVVVNDISLDCFINMGTSEEYGHNASPFREELVPDPMSLYSGTKSASTMLCRMFYNSYKIPTVTVRPSLVYGPGQNNRFFIIQAIEALVKDEDFNMTLGEQTRDFIFVEDLVRGITTVSQTSSLVGEAVNISSGIEYCLKDIILKIHKIIGSQSKINFGAIPYRENEIMRYLCDNSKAISLSGWKPLVSLDEGLKLTIEYYTRG